MLQPQFLLQLTGPRETATVKEMRRALLFALTIGMCSTAFPAAAQEAEGSVEDAEARALFNAGSLAFGQGRFEVALERFREAYELSPRPELLYNIGTAADRLRRDPEALEAFEEYLRQLPDAPNRAAVHARIATLRDSVSSAQAEPGAPESTGRGAAPWIVVGSGAALAIAGGVFVGIALSDRAELEGLTVEDGKRYEQIQDQEDRVGVFSAIGIIGIGVGIAAIGGGIVWAVTAGGDTSIALGPGSVSLRGTF